MTTVNKRRIYILIAGLILLGGIALILLPAKTTVLASIGTSLVASGIVVLLDLVYRTIVDEEGTAIKSILSSGLVNLYNRRDIEKYHVLMTSVTSRLDISGYSLRSFYESFSQTLVEHLRKNPGLKARILVVDPASQSSRAREALEQHKEGTFAASIARFKGTFGASGNLSIRAIPADITTMVFRLDNTMFVGPQFLSSTSRATVTMEIRQSGDSWLFRAYEAEFEQLWGMAHDI